MRKKILWQQAIAKERIEILFDLAKKELKLHPERSRRYVELARKIGLRYNVRLRKFRGKFCKKCNTLLVPGATAQIRLSKKFILTKCLHCGAVCRKGYKPLST